MLKVLHVTPTYPPAWSYGGITRVAYELTKELSRRGYHIEVWTSDAFDRHRRIKNTCDRIGSITVRRFKNLSFILTRVFYDEQFTLSLFNFAKYNISRFDIVHLHGTRTFQTLATYPFIIKARKPYILQAHGSLWKINLREVIHYIAYNLYNGSIVRRILREASKVIALSRVKAEQYRSMGVLEEKIAIIPNGIDLSEYASLPPKGQFKKKFNIPEDKKIVLYLGRIHKIKGKKQYHEGSLSFHMPVTYYNDDT